MRMFRTSMWCSWMAYDQRNSLVDPHIVYPLVRRQLAAAKPQRNLTLRRVDRIRAMNAVPADIDAVLPTDGGRVRVEWVGRPNHLASRGDHPLALKDQGQDLASVEWERAQQA